MAPLKHGHQKEISFGSLKEQQETCHDDVVVVVLHSIRNLLLYTNNVGVVYSSMYEYKIQGLCRFLKTPNSEELWSGN